jgi:peptidylprolyl isomerase
MTEKEYTVADEIILQGMMDKLLLAKASSRTASLARAIEAPSPSLQDIRNNPAGTPDPYSALSGTWKGWPLGSTGSTVYPTHCYGMVGVGRNLSPDTGSGAELYTVIGHAPRHLDRNIALVGRVIEGMEHLAALPRGKGALGFYAADEAYKRTPITSVRVASDLPTDDQPRFEYLSTESATFARYADAIANRRDPFFIVPAGGADICNIRVPVRRVAAGG